MARPAPHAVPLRERLDALAGRAGSFLVWLVLAALVAAGGAGVVASSDRHPGDGERPELTAAGDAAARPALDAVALDLSRAVTAVDDLGTAARGALAAIVNREGGDLDTALAAGRDALAAATEAMAAYDAARAAVPAYGTQDVFRLSPRTLARRDALASAAGATEGLAERWATFTARARVASRLAALLVRHDEIAGEAAALGVERRYADAIARLRDAQDLLVEATLVRNALAATADVSTLTTWLERYRAYDAALAELYAALEATSGRVTDRLRAAYAAEQAARAGLPEDTRGLVVIMGEVAAAGLNQAVVAIDEARGALGGALEDAAAADPDAVLPG